MISPTDLHLGGQNLAALGTTAGENLTAVGSSHSLAEAMDLGSVTTAGLVGTLHLHYTSCQKSIMLNSRKRPQQHIFTDHTGSFCSIITEKGKLVNNYFAFFPGKEAEISKNRALPARQVKK